MILFFDTVKGLNPGVMYQVGVRENCGTGRKTTSLVLGLCEKKKKKKAQAAAPDQKRLVSKAETTC